MKIPVHVPKVDHLDDLAASSGTDANSQCNSPVLTRENGELMQSP